MQTLGRYTLLRRVAAGGMAEIWKAKVVGPGGFEKSLAIKRVLPHLAEDTEFIEMFVEEAKLVAGLVHPNIVQVFDFGQIGETYFLAMEFVPGCNVDKLTRRLDEREMKLAANVGLFIAAETCRGLAFAHAITDATGTSRNLVHRDVSPQNILLSFGGDVKVGDFGIAKAVHKRSRTETGMVRGKSAYMSPEQARGEPLDLRSDLFSAGIVLYEMVAGKQLFTGTGTLDIMQKVAAFKGPTAEDLSFVPPALHDLFTTALAGTREGRYSDGLAMETAISWHLGADGAVRARQALGALVRELFQDEATRERAESSGEIAADPHATLDGAPAISAKGEVDSKKATVMRGGFGDIASRGKRSMVPIGLAVTGAALLMIAGTAWVSSHGFPGAESPTPAATGSVIASGSPVEGITPAVLGTGLALATGAPSPAAWAADDVESRQRELAEILLRRHLAAGDVADVEQAVENAQRAHAIGRRQQEAAYYDEAIHAAKAARITLSMMEERLERVKSRIATVRDPARSKELLARLDEAQKMIDTDHFDDASEALAKIGQTLDTLP